MIRYIKEREADLNEKEVQQSNPEIIVNHSSVALKSLKQTEDQYDAMRRRLSVLQIRDDKYNMKIVDNQRKLDFHARVQQSIARDKKRKMKFMKKMQQQLQQSKSRAKLQRQAHDEQLKMIKEDLSANKKSKYERGREQSRIIDQSVSEMKKSDRELKSRHKEQIRQMERKQKEHVAEYFLQKRNSFRESSVREGSGYESRRSEKERQIAQMNEIQSRLLSHQSSSRAALEDTYRRLQKITVKPVLHTRSTRQKSTDALSERLPQISSTQRYHDQYVVF